MLKKISWLLFLGGIVLGPGYWAYMSYYTGGPVTHLPLKPNAEGDLVSESFRLTPEMAPVGLAFQAQGHFKIAPEDRELPLDPYEAVFKHNGTAATPLKFLLKAKSAEKTAPVFNERLLLLSIKEPTEYQLQVHPVAPPRIQLEKPQLELRQQVELPDNRIVLAGVLSLSFGLLLLLM